MPHANTERQSRRALGLIRLRTSTHATLLRMQIANYERRIKYWMRGPDPAGREVAHIIVLSEEIEEKLEFLQGYVLDSEDGSALERLLVELREVVSRLS